MQDVLKQIGGLKIVPVVTVENEADAAGLGDALVAGGLPIAEITFRTPAAEASIRALARGNGLLLGAGTVLNVDTAKRAVDAGARFIVSPGFNPKTVGWCVANHVAIIPGIATATDIEMALDHGITSVKFFPAEALGGLAMIKILSGPFGMIRFMPSSGISPENVEEYLKYPKVFAVGGSWIATKEMVAARQFDKISELARAAVQLGERARPGK